MHPCGLLRREEDYQTLARRIRPQDPQDIPHGLHTPAVCMAPCVSPCYKAGSPQGPQACAKVPFPQETHARACFPQRQNNHRHPQKSKPASLKNGAKQTHQGFRKTCVQETLGCSSQSPALPRSLHCVRQRSGWYSCWILRHPTPHDPLVQLRGRHHRGEALRASAGCLARRLQAPSPPPPFKSSEGSKARCLPNSKVPHIPSRPAAPDFTPGKPGTGVA